MRKGVVDQLINYFFQNETYFSDLDRACKEFFLDLEGDDTDHHYFNEWLVFDFRLKNSRSLLEEFYQVNPLCLSVADLKIYQELQKNIYSFWKILKVKNVEGLYLRDIIGGKNYWVKEHLMTHEVKNNYCFCGRIAQVEGFWELVGASPAILPMIASGGEQFIKSLGPISLYDVFHHWIKKDINKIDSEYSSTDIDFQQTAKTLTEAWINLEKVLTDLKINQFVSVKTISDWIFYSNKKSYADIILSRLFGLMDIEFDQADEKKVDLLIKTFNDFYNLSTQKTLKGKSPQQLIKSDSNLQRNASDFIFNFIDIGGKDIFDFCDQAQVAMKERNLRGALNAWNKLFRYLLRKQTTTSHIYRFYANKAMCHFAMGQLE